MTPASPAAALTDRFRDYYAAVVDLRRRIESGASEGELEVLRAPLMSLLETLRTDDERSADAAVLREARYVMAAFADEHFTGFDWRLRDAWASATLEFKLFQTNEGGSAIFRRLDELLEVGDPGLRNVAKLYLLVLSIGFRGDLEPESAERTLRDYRRRLLEFVAPERGSGDPNRQLSPSAYLHTVGRAVAAPLPNLRRWAWLASGAVLLLLVMSYLVWSDATEIVAAIIERLPSSGAAQ